MNFYAIGLRFSFSEFYLKFAAMNKTALITGATSGIGKATAEIFAENNINLIICGRRKDRLHALAGSLEKKVKVHSLCFDVSRKEEVFNAVNSLPENFREINILVNNAGNAHGISSIEEGEVEDWDNMIDINVKGLLYVSKAVIPQMVKRKEGHIINIGSIAGREVYPNGNVYCASKFAVDALNKAMRFDLYAHGIKAGAINPGAVETEFSLVRFKGDEKRAASMYKGFQPLTARDIAEIILFTVTRPPHVNIADVLVLPAAQASVTLIKKES